MLLDDGSRQTAALVGAANAPTCSAGEAVGLVLSLDRTLPRSPVLMRAFERGEYHAVRGALRYRRGAGGRQPITPGRVGTGVFSVGPAPGPVARFSIRLDPDLPDRMPRTATWLLAGPW